MHRVWPARGEGLRDRRLRDASTRILGLASAAWLDAGEAQRVPLTTRPPDRSSVRQRDCEPRPPRRRPSPRRAARRLSWTVSVSSRLDRCPLPHRGRPGFYRRRFLELLRGDANACGHWRFTITCRGSGRVNGPRPHRLTVGIRTRRCVTRSSISRVAHPPRHGRDCGAPTRRGWLSGPHVLTARVTVEPSQFFVAKRCDARNRLKADRRRGAPASSPVISRQSGVSAVAV